MKTDQIVMLAALGAAAFFLTRQAGAAPVARKNAAPLIWAQHPTAANPQQGNTTAQKLNLLGAGLGFVSSLFGNTQSSSSSYVPTYQSFTPDYSFSTDMLGTASSAAQADLYAMNAPASYYGLGFDTSESATGSGWWN